VALKKRPFSMVSLACSGGPANTACSVNPASVTLSASAATATAKATVTLPKGVSGQIVWKGKPLPLHEGPQTVALR